MRKSTEKRQNLCCEAEKRDVEGKKKTRQQLALLKQNGVSEVKSAEILRPLTFARNYATIADRKSNLRRGKMMEKYCTKKPG